tara:strand:- start:20 stop:406 length:387 start_codon:yes stop_codon:yes gene_type:complete
VGFFITIATAFRLSKYNLMKNEFKFFVGLLAPANCMMILGLPFIFDYVGEKYLSYNVLYPFTLFSIYMLNSKIKLISLKNVNILIVITLLILMFVLTVFTNFAVLTIIILAYILFSISYFQLRRWISF